MSRPVGMPAAIAGELRHNWGWLLALGVLLLMLGIVALVDSVVATVTSALVFGWILLLAGIIEGVQTFRHRGSGHLLLHALNAVLAVVVGFMLLRNPLAGAVVMTLLLAIYFVVGGVFRIVAGWGVHAPGRGWVILNGIVTLVLGVLIWAQWPASGLWVIGLFIGIDLIVVGWSQVMTALAVRSLPMQI
ncbi:HdeD family acid-resistance protein [Rhodanobacter sp. DHG33]|uniref:HdeD family acid-resistance protein n=1 Tax=Rhodanobacter sp. DHG33 TaxID=2775921 RepID=UPI00178508D9|nr:HdeD family acid-resistance protein [Rhodanobacter sp. DHG33]MBD8897357.1 HdeD family acid-resistance protein [Rhodanobacter sp. DHG33]